MRVRSLDWEDPLEEGTATHFITLAWRIPWAEESGGLQSIGLHTTEATQHAGLHLAQLKQLSQINNPMNIFLPVFHSLHLTPWANFSSLGSCDSSPLSLHSFVVSPADFSSAPFLFSALHITSKISSTGHHPTFIHRRISNNNPNLLSSRLLHPT